MSKVRPISSSLSQHQLDGDDGAGGDDDVCGGDDVDVGGGDGGDDDVESIQVR